MYAVAVTFTIKPGQMVAFLPLIRANQAATRAGEPGCRQFDICTDPERPDEMFLYELYDDLEAFETHLTTPHFKEFDAASAALVADTVIRTYRTVAP